VERQWRDPRRAAELAALGFERPEHLAATFLAGPERLGALTASSAPLVDDFPHRLSTARRAPTETHRSGSFADLMDADARRRLCSPKRAAGLQPLVSFRADARALAGACEDAAQASHLRARG
jgi:hypothetical protein